MTDKPRGKATPWIHEYAASRVLRRRYADNCIAKRIYDKATPYIQIAGWIPVMGGIATGIYLICTFISNTEGYATQITGLHGELTKVDDKVLQQQQDIASLKKGQEDMAKEVHIIYSHLIKGHQ